MFVAKSFIANRPDKGVGLGKFYSVINYLQSSKNICTRLQTEMYIVSEPNNEFCYIAKMLMHTHLILWD